MKRLLLFYYFDNNFWYYWKFIHILFLQYVIVCKNDWFNCFVCDFFYSLLLFYLVRFIIIVYENSVILMIKNLIIKFNIFLYLCIRVIPRFLAWLVKRRYKIYLRVGHISLPYFILRDVNISKNGFTLVSFFSQKKLFILLFMLFS